MTSSADDLTPVLAAATARLADTVAGLPDDLWRAPSVCAGWSRAHVVAHTALNAEALGGVLRGAAAGRPVPMYPSNARRNGDIEELAASPPAELRVRLAEACAGFAAALEGLDGLDGLDGAAAAGTFERTPGGPVVPVRAVAGLRLREVEIHHADLDAGYSWRDWPAETAWRFLEADARRYDGPGFHVRSDDDARTVAFGVPGPEAAVVHGPLRALAWWATGRDPGPLVSSSTGVLPRLEGR